MTSNGDIRSAGARACARSRFCRSVVITASFPHEMKHCAVNLAQWMAHFGCAECGPLVPFVFNTSGLATPQAHREALQAMSAWHGHCNPVPCERRLNVRMHGAFGPTRQRRQYSS